MTFAINYLSAVALTQELTPALAKSGGGQLQLRLQRGLRGESQHLRRRGRVHRQHQQL